MKTKRHAVKSSAELTKAIQLLSFFLKSNFFTDLWIWTETRELRNIAANSGSFYSENTAPPRSIWATPIGCWSSTPIQVVPYFSPVKSVLGGGPKSNHCIQVTYLHHNALRGLADVIHSQWAPKRRHLLFINSKWPWQHRVSLGANPAVVAHVVWSRLCGYEFCTLHFTLENRRSLLLRTLGSNS